MKPFFTKKQKKLMRERRKKKRMYEKKQVQQSENGKYETKDDDDDDDDDDNEDNGDKLDDKNDNRTTTLQDNGTRKRPHDDGGGGVLNIDDHQSNSNQVIIPAGLTPKEAKKFRKDARRQARVAGRDETQLVFVSADSHDKKQSKETASNNKRRKVNQNFPNLNKLAAQQKRQEEQEHAEKVRIQTEVELSKEEKVKYVALDCEMVGVGSSGKQSALARASLVDWHGNVLLDSFVQVPTKVTDFRTKWSGVLPKHLQSRQAMTVDACRQKVTQLLRDKILVGHALKNDLDVLMLTHPPEHIRDTAKYRPYQRHGGDGKWRPRKLRDLVAENVPDMTIQRPGESHDSVDDARAAMEVFKRARVAWEAALARKLRRQKKE